jgi:hypothetical protein
LYGLPFSFILFGGPDGSSSKAEMAVNQKLIRLIPKQSTEILPLGIDVGTSLDAHGSELALQDSPNSVHFPWGKLGHEIHNGTAIGRKIVLPIRLVHVGTNLGEPCVCGDAGRY